MFYLIPIIGMPAKGPTWKKLYHLLVQQTTRLSWGEGRHLSWQFCLPSACNRPKFLWYHLAW